MSYDNLQVSNKFEFLTNIFCFLIGFVETINLRNVKGSNLNYSCNDVVWSHLDPIMLATAATNGAIIIWNIAGTGGQKQKYIDTILNEHKRIVNKINFHPSMNKLLLSGSQDGSMRLFDLRIQGEPTVIQMSFSQMESVRDVEWNPHKDNQIAAVSENGQVQLWDIRRCDRAEIKWSAHADHIYTCEWHPEQRNVLATAGRDKCIKVWDTSSCSNMQLPEQRHTIYAMDAVSKVHWRPRVNNQIASLSLMSDFAIHVWDLQRPFVPFASFTEHTDIPTSFLWRNEPSTLLSAGKDNRLYQHAFSDAKWLALQANPIGLSFNVSGELLYAFRDGRTQEIVPSNMGSNKQSLHSSNQTTIGSSKLSISGTSKPAMLDSAMLENVQKLPPLSQKSLQAYFEKVENSPQELFRSNSSFMVQIDSSVFGVDIGCTDSDEDDCAHESPYENGDDETHFLTNQQYIKYTAKHYRYTGMPFTKLCNHNSNLASSLGRCQLATAWQVIKSIYLTDSELVSELLTNDSKSKIENENVNESPEDNFKTMIKPEISQKHISTNPSITLAPIIMKDEDLSTAKSSLMNTKETLQDARISAGVSGVSIETAVSKRQNRSRNRMINGKTPDESSQESSDDCDGQYNDTLTNIASGHMLSGSVGRGLTGGHQDGDFFGDMENAILYRFDNLNPNNFPLKSDPDFSNLPTEAFEYRRELPDESLETVQSWKRPVNPSEQHLDENTDSKEDHTILQTTVTLVNNTVSTLNVDLELCRQIDNETEMWNPDNIFLENLEYYSNLNDVQTTVAMYLVALERMKNPRLVNNHIVCHWFSCYVDQLQQMKLFSEANQIMDLCPLSSVNSQTTRSTFIKTFCGNCEKLIETNRLTSTTRATSGKCRKCLSTANVCAICHKPVQGLYAWCQGCGHGGHLDHISEWLKENKKCPFGCGHRCEYD